MAYLSRNKDKNPIRPILLSVLVGISLFLSALFLLSPEASSQKSNVTGEPVPVAEAAPVVPEPRIESHSVKLSGNDTFYQVMTDLGVSGADIYTITKKARPIYDLKYLKRGEVMDVTTADGEFSRLEFRFGETDILKIEKAAGEQGGYMVSKVELPSETRQVIVVGTIKTSLYEDGIKAGADPMALMELSDIFAWDVDFASDIRKGDTFSVLTEVLYVNGEAMRTERVLGAEMVNDGKKYTAIYFRGKNGNGYYDENGKSLRRTLLKSPLRYRRISSYFTKRRYHPILKKYRPHHGIDYAAPVGTPVESAGSGRVTFAGWKRGYGNFVTVRHNNGYSTSYGHFSRIARGIRRGVKVDQGDVIGYVGSTGISTGPHLHYEVRLHNRLINPLRIKAVADKTVRKADGEAFALVKADVERKLNGIYAVASTATR
ncbi:MAG: peptidoglycan DD-metalloendopeptidase family protein [Thermodesulfobacteriota bacterium]